MALFKISKGSVANLDNQAKVDGYAWFTPEDGKFYIDAPIDKTTERIQLNSTYAVSATLTYANSTFTLGTPDKAYADVVKAKAAGNYVFFKLTFGDLVIMLPLSKTANASITFEGDFIYNSAMLHGNIVMNSSGSNSFTCNTVLGGTYLGDFSAGSKKITNLADPVASTDAVSLNYLSTNYKKVQTAVASPSSSSSAIDFIDTISQNAQGVITATKKAVREASTSQSGVVSTGVQSFAGNKTFTNKVTTPSLQITNGALIGTATGSVLGTSKTVTTVGQQLVLQGGAVFSGTAQNAGLVTRGICGVSTPGTDGTCSKECLYINYDGDNTYNSDRGIVLNAGTKGKDLGKGLYQYLVPRGDVVAAYAQSLFSTNDAMLFKGVLGTDTDMIKDGLPAEHEAGWTYKVGTAGSYANQWCEIGDTIYCIKDGTTASNDDWAVIQVNNEGIIYRKSRDVAVGSESIPVYVSDSGFVTACTNSKITGVGSALTCTGNSATATKLATAKTLTIGNTGKSFNGSANVSWTLSEIGAAASNHTHSYAGSSSAGGAANSVANSFIIKLNGGSTEDTNLFTFNGSAAKTVNITASGIGAAASSHTHSYLPLSGGTLTGNLTVGSATIQTNGYLVGTWLQTTSITNKGSNTGKIAVIDSSGWVYYRTPAEIKSEMGAGNTNRVVAQNKTVATSAWASNSTYSDYPYRAAIAITGVTASHLPEVIFSCSDATGGNFAPVCESYAGGVYIWAKEKPTATVTIPTIECRITA